MSVHKQNPSEMKKDSDQGADPDQTTDPEIGLPEATIDQQPKPDGRQAIDEIPPARPEQTIDQPSQPAPNQTIEHRPVADAKPGQTIGFEGDAPAGDQEEPQHTPKPSLPAVTGYELLGELGRGGMGVVYKARQIKLNRLVALKMVLAGAHAGSEQLARFYTEAEAVAQLQHPNIVQIYEVSEHDGLPFFSLEYVDGGSLNQKIAGKPQPIQEAAQTAEILALAMASAHQHGIIHRDLKPANVLLTQDGLPKITDFGLAKRLESDSGQTRSGTLMGTPSYMAPEQARGDTHEIGPLADQYALGVILYELLTGRTPFIGTSIVDTLKQVQNQEPVAPSRLQPTVPRDLDTICLKCLQKEPQKRYASVDALADDLHRFVAGEPILARPVGRVERIWRWCKRNPRVASLYAAVATLLVTVGVFLTLQTIRNARERETTSEVSKLAQERLTQATKAIQGGSYRQAQTLLQWSDPVVETNPALVQTRDQLHQLRAQVDLYTEFKELLDRARYYALFGQKETLKEALASGKELIGLYDQIEQKAGRAQCGLPPLNDHQRQLLQEEFFETFLVLAQVEDLVAGTVDESKRKAAAQKAVAWLDRAEKIFPEAWALFFRRAGYLEKLGDAKRAKADAQRAAKMRPATPLDRFWFGLALHLEGDAIKEKDAAKAQEKYRRALQEYAILLRLRPDHFWGYFDGALCHFQLSNLDEAVISFTVCVQLRPEVVWSYFNRGQILRQQKQFDAAAEDFTMALERNPLYAEAFVHRGLAYAGLDKHQSALEDFDKALRINPDQALGLVSRADSYRKLNRLPEALADYERARQFDPKNPTIYSGRGNAYLALADYSKARADFATLIKLQPNQALSHRLYGVASLRLLDFEAAHRSWKELEKLLPKDPEPHHNAAITFKAERKLEDALKAEAQAIQKKPNGSSFYLFRAQINHQQGKLKEALAEITFVLTKLKDNKAEILNDHGDLLRTMGRLPEAMQTYQVSIQKLPKQTDAYVGMALIHLLEGKPELADPIIAQMMTANANAFRALLRRAEFLRSCNRWDDALKDCDQAAKLEPKSPLPDLVRASIRAARGEFRQAVQDAEKVMQALRPDGHALVAAACVWSLACQAATKNGEMELAQEYADRAAVHVADAMLKGFLDLNYQAYNRMLIDPALAPIRQHPRVLEIFPVLRQAEGPAS